jgi:hypothetical protein
MIQSPITRVLSSMKTSGVRCLLMGGQACVFYGAAEFSRDIDLAILCETDNLTAIQRALDDLQAKSIAVPLFEKRYLDRGHAVHFRCQAPGVQRLRIDLLAKMRGVDAFPELWNRRTTILVDELEIDLMSLPDLVRAKRTQRAKDWPMVARLLEAHYYQNKNNATEDMVRFWLREMHDVELLARIVADFPQVAQSVSHVRASIQQLSAGNREQTERLLREEIDEEKRADREHWLPLKQELNELRKRRRE